MPLVDDVGSPPPEEVHDGAESRLDTTEGKRAAAVLDRLEETYPEPYCFLDAETPFQLLCAVVLSAQCTDATVNETTPELFDRWPTPEALAEADREELEEVIYSTGFYSQKAGYLQETAQRIVDEHDGDVPRTLDDLTDLSGVARKTATVVLWHAFGRVEGITVDTHVQRLANRLGLVDAESPRAVERALMEILPQERWPTVTYHFISHGRARCPARDPDCQGCEVRDLCPSAGTFED
jgi:endonuclease-3